MEVKRGDVIRVHYTGKIKETGEIFDTTREDVAKEAGIYSEKGIYGPVPIAIGAGHVLEGLDRRLEGLEVGKKYEIEVPPEEGFGKRDRKLIKTFTLGQFRREGLWPYPGMPVEIETESGKKIKGRVLTVSGGRVRVDFNHPYAGKHLLYEVEIVEKIEDPIEKVKAMIELRLPMVDRNKIIIEVGEKEVIVDFTPILEEIDKNTLVLGEMLLERDLKFIGYEEVKFKPSVEEILKPLEEKQEGKVDSEKTKTKELEEERAMEEDENSDETHGKSQRKEDNEGNHQKEHRKEGEQNPREEKGD